MEVRDCQQGSMRDMRELNCPFGSVDFGDLAGKLGTPCYLYSLSSILSAVESYREAFDGQRAVCYSVKANNNPEILRQIYAAGCGFDIVSAGELQALKAVGVSSDCIVFSGVGKTDEELSFAASMGVRSINLESESEFRSLRQICQDQRKTQGVMIRVRTGSVAGGHTYLQTAGEDAKFGLSPKESVALARQVLDTSGLRLRGFAFHLGSEICEIEPYLESMKVILECLDRLGDYSPQEIDIGGGIGISGVAFELRDLRQRLDQLCREYGRPPSWDWVVEPGRYIVGRAGALLTKVVRTKSESMVVVDAGMMDFIRPALYKAKVDIESVFVQQGGREAVKTRVVGPACESGDVFGDDHRLSPLTEGDLLLIKNAGAYGMCMASNYNFTARPAEALIEDGDWRLIRQREDIREMIKHAHQATASARHLRLATKRR